MKIIWSGQARRDLIRLHDFLRIKSPRAGLKAFQTLGHAPDILMRTPRLGERIDEIEDREVRRIFAGDYELRYEISGDEIRVLRIWHTRENR